MGPIKGGIYVTTCVVIPLPDSTHTSRRRLFDVCGFIYNMYHFAYLQYVFETLAKICHIDILNTFLI